jgi:superfamily II DNA or RNA helicase
MAIELARPYRRPLFVVPRVALVTQSERAFAAEGVSCTVATVHTFLTREGLGDHDFVGFDEARHYVADRWVRVMNMVPPSAGLAGYDATPERGDGRGMGSHYDEIVEAISIRDAIDGGYLTPCRVIRPKKALAPGQIAAHPIDAYEAHAAGLAAVVYAASIETGESFLRTALERGHRATIVHSRVQVEGTQDNREELQRRLDAFDRGEYEILINVAMLTEGWDSPRVACVIMATSVGTAGGMLQRVGRALRPFPGKDIAIFIDLAGVTHTHGDPDEPREWKLRGIASVLTNRGPRFCPACGQISDADKECTKCGHKGVMRKRKPKVTGDELSAKHERDRTLPDEQAAIELSRLRTIGFINRWHPRKANAIWASKYQRPITPEIEMLSKCVVRRGSEYVISDEKKQEMISRSLSV